MKKITKAKKANKPPRIAVGGYEVTADETGVTVYNPGNRGKYMELSPEEVRTIRLIARAARGVYPNVGRSGRARNLFDIRSVARDGLNVGCTRVSWDVIEQFGRLVKV